MINSLIDWVFLFCTKYLAEFNAAFLIYVTCFCIFEMIVHEFGHYYFQKKFGVDVIFFKIGIFNLFTQTLSNGTKVILGIPFWKAESRGVGELSDEEKEKNNPRAFYYCRRHPKEQFLVAIGGALAVLTVCAFVLMTYFINWKALQISTPPWLLICFAMCILNQLFNAFIPIKIGKQATDAWVAYRALYEWYKKSR